MHKEALKSFVETLLATMGYPAERVEVVGTHRTTVAVTSNESKELIGPNGDHLHALNTIARRMVERAHGEDASSFFIDINEYREAELERVRQQALMLAQRARLFKHDVELPPQSAYERLVVHELFAEDPEIATESTGEGKFRRIVLRYKTTA